MNRTAVPPALHRETASDASPLKRVAPQMFNTSSFLERLDFTRETPHTVRSKGFPANELVPLHYASSVEILLALNVNGAVTVGQMTHTFRPKDVIYIPPNVVHSTNIMACEGTMTNVKLSMEMLEAFINLQGIFAFLGLKAEDIPILHDCYDQARTIVDKLIADDDNIFLRMKDILELCELLARNAVPSAEASANAKGEKQVHGIITWTDQHYMEKITLEEAAAQMHFSKCYFCKFFKAVTGITYLTYLNQVRVSKAMQMLREGRGVTEAATFCGYTNVSYFINLFRQINGCTPGEYVRRIVSKRR